MIYRDTDNKRGIMRKKTYTRGLLTFTKASALLVATLLFASSCGSSNSGSASEELLSAQLAETQEQIEQLQQTIQDLQQDAEVESSQSEVLQEEPDQNGEEVIEESDDSEIDQTIEEETTLLGSYSWLENSEAVEELQEFLGVEPDGWYGAITREAHLAALEEKGLSAEAVPEERAL